MRNINKIFLKFSIISLSVSPSLAQIKCVEYLKNMADLYITAEESGGRKHGECNAYYQLVDENKCHAWTAALWDPMIAESKICSKKHSERICVHDIAVNLPGTHNYIGITVSKQNHKAKGFAVDGWRCKHADRTRMSIDHGRFYEMHSIYDSGDPEKRFTYNISPNGTSKKHAMGYMVSKRGYPLWEPAWIEADGIAIGNIECFGPTPTNTPTPTRTPTETPTGTPTRGSQECGPDEGSCEYPSCCNYSGYCGTDPESCGDDCNPLYGYCHPTATPSSTPTPSPSPTPTSSPTVTVTLTPLPTNTPYVTETPCPTLSGSGISRCGSSFVEN